MKTLLLGLVMATPLCLMGEVPDSPEPYINNMIELTDYSGQVSYSVLLPQAEDPVSYDIKMRSTVVAADSLAPCRYLIEWIPGREELGTGFAAYLNGSHYRYRAGRLQEYHMEWDSIPFIMGNGGVQCNAQFADVLPQFIGHELKRLVADTNFVYTFSPDTIYSGRRVAVMEGKVMYHGYVSKEATYVFDPVNLMPVVIEYENNPGSISEQSVSIKYINNENRPFGIVAEDDLIELYPDVFEKYRESNFRVENLPGTQLPTFTAPTPGGERYVYHRGDKFVSPVVLMLVDDSGANTPTAIESVRKAVDMSPVSFDIIIAFVSADSERVSDITGKCRHGETILTGAKSLARDCGVNAFPTLLYVGSDGRVTDVILGYNKDLVSIVIQKASLYF